MRSVTKAISRPFQANSQGHEPLRRCVAATVVSAAVSNSDCMTPFGQTMRTTSACAASPRPKWTTGASIVCFCTCRPVRSSTSPPMPKELMRWSPVAVAERGRSACQW